MTTETDLTSDHRSEAAEAVATARRIDPLACAHCHERRAIMVQMLGNWFLCSACWIEGRQSWKLGRVRVVKS